MIMLLMDLNFEAYPFRLIYLGINSVIIYMALQLAYLFFTRGWKKDRDALEKVYIALGIGFCFIGINYSLKLLNHYVIDIPNYQKVLYFSAAAAATFAITVMEPIFRKNRFFTDIAIIITILYAIIPPTQIWIYIPIGLTALILIFPVLFFIHLFRNTTKFVKKRIWGLIISLLILYLGIVLDLERNTGPIRTETFVIIGGSAVLAGILGIYLSFSNINVFIESGWRQNLEALYIIHKSTFKPLYTQNLLTAPNDSQPNNIAEFVSGSIVGIDAIMKDISQSQAQGTKGISLIESKGKYILIEHAQDAIVCFICTKNLEALRFYLRKIRDAWEFYYCTRSIDWDDASQELFGAMKTIVAQILEKE